MAIHLKQSEICSLAPNRVLLQASGRSALSLALQWRYHRRFQSRQLQAAGRSQSEINSLLKRRPDIIAVDDTGKVFAIEITSPSDVTKLGGGDLENANEFLHNRMNVLREALPAGNQGKLYSHSPEFFGNDINKLVDDVLDKLEL